MTPKNKAADSLAIGSLYWKSDIMTELNTIDKISDARIIDLNQSGSRQNHLRNTDIFFSSQHSFPQIYVHNVYANTKYASL